MNEYLAIGSGEYLCMNSLCALIAAWLDASQRSQDGALLNRWSKGHLGQSRGLDTALFMNLPSSYKEI